MTNQPNNTAERELYVGDLFAAARVRWRLVTFVTLLAAAGAVAFVIGQGKLYLAQARVGVRSDLTGAEAWQAVDACLGELDSPAFSRRAAGRLQLVRERGFQLGLWGEWGRLWQRVAGADTAKPGLPQMAWALQSRLCVRRSSGSDAVEIGVLAASPAMAARLANGVAEALVEQVTDSQPAPNTAPERTLPGPSASGLAARRIELSARAEELAAFLKKGGSPSTSDVPSVAGDALLAKLRADLADLAQRRDALGRKFGPKHPDMRELDQQRQIVLRQIRAEAKRALGALRRELSAIRQEETGASAAAAPVTAAPRPKSLPPMRVLRQAEEPSAPYRTGQAIIVGTTTACGLAAAALLALALERKRLRRPLPSAPEADEQA